MYTRNFRAAHDGMKTSFSKISEIETSNVRTKTPAFGRRDTVPDSLVDHQRQST